MSDMLVQDMDANNILSMSWKNLVVKTCTCVDEECAMSCSEFYALRLALQFLGKLVHTRHHISSWTSDTGSNAGRDA